MAELIADLAFYLSFLNLFIPVISVYQIILLGRLYRANPAVAMAAIFNRGSRAFKMIGASAMAFSLIEIAGILIIVFVIPNDELLKFYFTSVVHSIAGLSLSGFNIALYFLTASITQALGDERKVKRAKKTKKE